MTIETATALMSTWATDTRQRRTGPTGCGRAARESAGGGSALVDARWGYLAAITGLDLGVEAGQFEVLYHFCPTRRC